MYQRSVTEFQQRQRRLELEHTELLSKVLRLTDEVSILSLFAFNTFTFRVQCFYFSGPILLLFARSFDADGLPFAGHTRETARYRTTVPAADCARLHGSHSRLEDRAAPTEHAVSDDLAWKLGRTKAQLER